MQGKNSTRTTGPRPGDGTQPRAKTSQKTNQKLGMTGEKTDANWFGASQEPQEEFIENDSQAPHPDDRKEMLKNTSEGRPTFGSTLDE